MFCVAGVGFPTAGGAVAEDQDVGVLLTSFALAPWTVPPHQRLRDPSIPRAGQHQILLVISHIGRTHRFFRGDICRGEMSQLWITADYIILRF